MKRKTFFWILSVLTMLFIFIMSHKNATASDSLSMPLVSFWSVFGFDITTSNFGIFHTIIRKLGHISEFFFLAFCLYNALICDFNLKKSLFLTFIISFLYAISDEFHQIFIPGRCGKFTDVLIDSIGILSFILIILLYKSIANILLFKKK